MNGFVQLCEQMAPVNIRRIFCQPVPHLHDGYVVAFPGKAEAFLASGEAASDNYHLLTDGNVFFIQIGDVMHDGPVKPWYGRIHRLSSAGGNQYIRLLCQNQLLGNFRIQTKFQIWGTLYPEHHGFEKLYNILFEGQLF